MSEIKNVVRELAEVYRAGGVKTTRFSLTLTEKDNLRIEQAAGDLQLSKQELVSRLLLAALTDLEEELNYVNAEMTSEDHYDRGLSILKRKKEDGDAD